MRLTSRLLPSLLAASLIPALVQAQAPIQEWIDNAVKAGGGVVTIPPGVHELSTGLRLGGAKKLALRGMERGACVLRLMSGDSSAALISIGAEAETVEIANLVLEAAPASGQSKPARPAAILCGPGGAPAKDGASTGPRDVTLRDCVFQNWPGDAVHFMDTRDAGVERCSFRDIGGTAVKISAQSKAVTISGCWITRARTGMEARDSAICDFTGNELSSCVDGILVSGRAALKQADRPTGHKIVNNRLGPVEKASIQVASTAAALLLADNELTGTVQVEGDGHVLKNNTPGLGGQ